MEQQQQREKEKVLPAFVVVVGIGAEASDAVLHWNRAPHIEFDRLFEG